MGLDPDLEDELAALRTAGWQVVVASAGCEWYIRRLLDEAGVALEVHSNPGRILGGRLVMELPSGSPYYSAEEPASTRRRWCAGGRLGGDGRIRGRRTPRPGAGAMVPAAHRFARGYLAEALKRRGEGFHPFERWAEVSRVLRSV